MKKTLITNIGVLCTAMGSSALGGEAQGNISKISNACILIEDGKIAYAGAESQLDSARREGCGIYNAGGKLVTPGLVDSHTHLVFGGWRQNEIPLKLKGAGYLDILKMGGGILSTVRSTRAASKEELIKKGKTLLDEMLQMGVTSCEIKSGYGLDTQTEIKQLEAIAELNRAHPMDISATFLGAHAVPDEFKSNREAYIDLLCNEMIPLVAEKKLAQYCDVFCETGVFDVAESRRILEAGKKHGLIPKIHADEIDAFGGAELAGEIGAISAEHLIASVEGGMQAMKKGGVIAALLPSTSFYLGATFAPARRMVELGIPVAIASDFNPGSCPSLNLQLAINLAMLRYRLTPEEILTAVTLNAAAAIGLAQKTSTLECGKQADIVIWDADDLETIVYRFGSNLAKTVIKCGQIL